MTQQGRVCKPQLRPHTAKNKQIFQNNNSNTFPKAKIRDMDEAPKAPSKPKTGSVCVLVTRLWLSATPWTVAHQAPLHSRGVLQARILALLQGSLPDPEMEPESPAFSGRFFTIWATRETQGLLRDDSDPTEVWPENRSRWRGTRYLDSFVHNPQVMTGVWPEFPPHLNMWFGLSLDSQLFVFPDSCYILNLNIILSKVVVCSFTLPNTHRVVLRTDMIDGNCAG